MNDARYAANLHAVMRDLASRTNLSHYSQVAEQEAAFGGGFSCSQFVMSLG
jgi:hypothetical protein